MSQPATTEKRKPGRPRKAAPDTAPTTGPDGSRVVHADVVCELLGGISNATLSRMAARDPDFPPPFSMIGYAKFYVLSDVEEYIRLKSQAAKSAKAAKLQKVSRGAAAA
jgi:predicted DNA-binding transcriptional regulator AlpA